MGIPANPARKAGALLVALGLIAGAPTLARAKCADPYALRAETGRFDFIQTRRMASMKTPLVSRGVAEVKPGRVDWRVVDPVDVLLTITPGRITQSVQGGKAQAVGPASADPFLRSSGLFEMLTGDFNALRRYYTVAGGPRAPGAPWKLTLKPKDANLGRFLSTIEISGCNRAEGVLIRQGNGDTIAIEMSAIRKA
ncbi:MAG: outer membrane lipoprotein carrier protein LolA [Caulobacter sp.]